MLAQLQVDPMNLGVFIACVMVVFFAANQITGTMANLKKIREKPVTVESLYVTHAQFDAFKIESTRQLVELRNEINSDMKAMLQSIARVTGILEAREFTRNQTNE